MIKSLPNDGSPWPAVDGLGRVLPEYEEVGPPRANKFVGVFYFLWLGQHDITDTGPFNVREIMNRHPDALKTPTSPPWGPGGHMYFWDEPLFGYYLNSDPWVLRRHAYLLADAGIDTLIFDTTNNSTYRDVYMELCKVFAQVREEGGSTPYIAFMVNTDAGERAETIFRDLYEPGLFQDLWFIWKGKPLMLCDPEKASQELRMFFTLRKAHWPQEQINTPYAWHWEAAYPQVYGYTDDPEKPEQINVSVAQNLRAANGKVTSMSRGDARGRSFHDGELDRSRGAVNYGHNAKEQWRRALEVNPPFLMVTGWNEWIAARFQSEHEPVMFVDQFDQEFSRDIEMMKGGHGDNYYYQLVDGVRKFKGMPPIPRAGDACTIDLDAGFEQWTKVVPEYRDHSGETIHRDFPGVSKLHYRNASGRNEFRLMRVARDTKVLYFYVRTEDPISPWRSPHWMMLLINSDQDPDTGWNGYNFIVNRKVIDENTSLIERYAENAKWELVGHVKYRVEGNQMHLAIPRSLCGIPDNADITLDFKWADNVVKPLEIMDFYLSGDVAPAGRFSYRYKT